MVRSKLGKMPLDIGMQESSHSITSGCTFVDALGNDDAKSNSLLGIGSVFKEEERQLKRFPSMKPCRMGKTILMSQHEVR